MPLSVLAPGCRLPAAREESAVGESGRVLYQGANAKYPTVIQQCTISSHIQLFYHTGCSLFYCICIKLGVFQAVHCQPNLFFYEL